MREQKSGCQEIPIVSWEDFDKRMKKHKEDNWLFRGQSNAEWDLETSLGRVLNENQEIIDKTGSRKKTLQGRQRYHEVFLIKTFQENAERFRSELGFLSKPFPDFREILEWLAIMQHYEAPTRLLDVTCSPDVAVHFALYNAQTQCSVYAINTSKLKEWNFFASEAKDYESLIFGEAEGERERFVGWYTSKFKNERQKSQHGSFLIPSQINEFYCLFHDYQDFPSDYHCIKYIIPPELKLEGLVRLNQKDVTSNELFPDIGGFSRSLRFRLLGNDYSFFQ